VEYAKNKNGFALGVGQLAPENEQRGTEKAARPPERWPRVGVAGCRARRKGCYMVARKRGMSTRSNKARWKENGELPGGGEEQDMTRKKSKQT